MYGYDYDSNYYSDHRVRAGRDGNGFLSVDEQRMIGIVVLYDEQGDDEQIEVPIAFSVCQTCEGRGSHTNPSVDCNGISGEDFERDQEFREEYYSGVYDVSCYGCNGKRVTPDIDVQRCDPDILKKLRQQQEEDAEFRRIEESERRMGA